MLLFGQAEGEDGSFFKVFGRLVLGLGVGPEEDGAQAQGAYLKGVPVGKTVKAEDLGEIDDARRIPAGIVAKALWRQELSHDLVFLHEVKEFGIPRAGVEIIFHLLEAAAFEEVDGFQHDLFSLFVSVLGDDLFGV